MHHTRPKHAVSSSINAILSMTHTEVADRFHRLAVNSISTSIRPTKNLDRGSRYFSSVTDRVEACPWAVVCEPDFVTLRIPKLIRGAEKAADKNDSRNCPRDAGLWLKYGHSGDAQSSGFGCE